MRSATRIEAACLSSAAREAALIAFPRQPRTPTVAAVYGRAVAVQPVFIAGRANTCPGCHAQGWNVGRRTAECAACGTPLPIVNLIESR
jgi:hypothetical protein